MEKILSLNGKNWKMEKALPGQGIKEGFFEENFWDRGWQSATIPGDVYSDLLEKDVIPEPYFGHNIEKVKWVRDYEWWYRYSFNLKDDFKGKHIYLVFEGVDYEAIFWLNGKELGKHKGMFSSIFFDITKLIKFGQLNKLSVCLSPPPQNRISIGGKKSCLGYFLDYNPLLIPVGIWEPAYTTVSEGVLTKDLYIFSEIKEGKAEVKFQFTARTDFNKSVKAKIKVKVQGYNFKSKEYEKTFTQEINPSDTLIEEELSIPEPNLWWPWDMGKQNLYQLTAEIEVGKHILDTQQELFGIREIKMMENDEAPEGNLPMVFTINGVREFIRGANWTCVDMLYGRCTEEKYKKVLQLVREANMNMLRIHGHHLREKKIFYDICDRLGILIWQEFPFGNANYPQTEEFFKDVRRECGAIVKRIRNRPCLATWCAGNEFSYEKNSKLMRTLKDLCKKLDPSRPYFYSDINPESKWVGDRHSWQVWHGARLKELPPYTYYSRDNSLFTAEFGLQSIPEKDTLEKFIPKEELRSYGPTWKYHFAEFEKLKFYAQNLIPSENISTLEGFIKASQRAQGEGLKYGIEHYRRRKYRTSGCMFWVFNEPWPEITWSVVDWFNRPKLSYYFVKEAYSPVLVSMKYPKLEWSSGEEFKGEIWVINDLKVVFASCKVEAHITDEKGKALEECEFNATLEKDSAQKIGEIKWKINSLSSPLFKVKLILRDKNEQILSKNCYTFKCSFSKV